MAQCPNRGIRHMKAPDSKWPAGAAVQTDGGDEVLLYVTDAPGDFPIHGRIVSRVYGSGAPLCWTEHGVWSGVFSANVKLHSLNLKRAENVKEITQSVA